MTESMELFSARVCPYAHRTRLVLHEKGVDFDLTEIDLSDKPRRFLDVSAYGKVPALVHGGVEIYESAVINEYLEECFPEPSLLPADPHLRAFARIWIDYCNNRFADDYYALLKNNDASRQPELQAAMVEHFRFIDTRGLARFSDQGPYWLGAEPSLVDMTYFPHFERLPAWKHLRGLEIPADCKRLLHWLDVMRARDSVKAIANSADYYVEHYKKYAAAG